MLVIRKEAKEDIKASYSWYEEQRAGLGLLFLAEVERMLESVQATPEAHEVVGKNVRRALCRKFPYAIYFLRLQTNIIVLAVLHQRRRPSTWQQRR